MKEKKMGGGRGRGEKRETKKKEGWEGGRFSEIKWWN